MLTQVSLQYGGNGTIRPPALDFGGPKRAANLHNAEPT